MRNFLILFVFIAFHISCSNDDTTQTPQSTVSQETPQSTVTPTTETSAGFNLSSITNTPISEIKMFAYSQDVWEAVGDQPDLADYEAIELDFGKFNFPNLNSESIFNESNNYQNTFRFSIHYVINNQQYTKIITMIINKGDQKNENIFI